MSKDFEYNKELTKDLGKKAEDTISKQSGLITNVSFWLYGCNKYGISKINEIDDEKAVDLCIDQVKILNHKKVYDPVIEEGLLLGSWVEDKITGLKGYLTARCVYLFDTDAYLITPKVNKDKELQRSLWVDKGRISIIDLDKKITPKEVSSGSTKTGGRESTCRY